MLCVSCPQCWGTWFLGLLLASPRPFPSCWPRLCLLAEAWLHFGYLTPWQMSSCKNNLPYIGKISKKNKQKYNSKLGGSRRRPGENSGQVYKRLGAYIRYSWIACNLFTLISSQTHKLRTMPFLFSWQWAQPFCECIVRRFRADLAFGDWWQTSSPTLG